MATTSSDSTNLDRTTAVYQLANLISRRWWLTFSLLLGLYVGIPFLAPVFKLMGWDVMANGIYVLYSTQCHQMAQRSFFLFGEKTMYSLTTIQRVWQDTNDPQLLGQFIGNPQLGWKVAWSDRMVSMYASTLFFSLLWYPFRRKVKPLPWWGFLLLLLPMGMDGITHMISDLSGIGLGFRYHNAWLAKLTNFTWSSSFYVGDALGSFNSWMRLISGIFFGLGVVWFGYPLMEEAISSE